MAGEKISVSTKVAEKLAELGGSMVEDRVVDTMLEREIEKRSNALVKVMDLLEQAEKSFKKLGPDQHTFNVDGSKATEGYSKSRIDERNKATKQVARLTGAINKALGPNKDYGDVYNLASGKLKAEDDAVGEPAKQDGDTD